MFLLPSDAAFPMIEPSRGANSPFALFGLCFPRGDSQVAQMKEKRVQHLSYFLEGASLADEVWLSLGLQVPLPCPCLPRKEMFVCAHRTLLGSLATGRKTLE